MKRDSFILKLYQSESTVFTAKEIALLLGVRNIDTLKSRINYYVKKGDITAVRRGIYVKNNYNNLELATKIYSPSYISLETVLEKEGVIFQHYEAIFVISYLSRKLIVDKKEIQIKKIKNDVLLNPIGILKESNYAIASKERALLDVIYLYKDYYFDNLKSIEWDRAFEIARIYETKKLIKKLNTYFKNSKNA